MLGYQFLILIFALTVSSIVADDEPNLTDILLTEDGPTSNDALEYLGQSSALKFITDVENATIYLAVASPDSTQDLSDYLLYDSCDLSNLIGDLNNVTGILTSESGCFIVWHKTSNYNPIVKVFVTILPLNYKACEGPNIFTAGRSDYSVPLSIASTDEGPCEMIILADPNGEFTSVWIESIKSDSNVILKSYRNDKHIWDINIDDVAYFKDFGVYVETLSLLIENSSYLDVSISGDSWDNHIITYDTGIQKGIMVSPSFDGVNQGTMAPESLYIIQANGNPPIIKIIVRELNGDGALTCRDETGKSVSLTEIDKMYTFNVPKLEVLFEQLNQDLDSFLLEYSIEDGPTPTLGSSTTLKTTKLVTPTTAATKMSVSGSTASGSISGESTQKVVTQTVTPQSGDTEPTVTTVGINPKTTETSSASKNKLVISWLFATTLMIIVFD